MAACLNPLMDLQGLLWGPVHRSVPCRWRTWATTSSLMVVWGQVRFGEAMICLEEARHGKGQGNTSGSPFFSPRAAATTYLGLCDPLRGPSAAPL